MRKKTIMQENLEINSCVPSEFNFIANHKVSEGETNDVFYGFGKFNNKPYDAYIKINKNPKLSLLNENYLLLRLTQSGIKVPAVLWHGCINRETIILQALKGNMLWDYIDPRRKLYTHDKILAYLYEYGKSLAEIHNLPLQCEKQIRQKLYNVIDEEKNDDFEYQEIIEWLKAQNISCNYDTFVHGDYNLANVIFSEDKVS